MKSQSQPKHSAAAVKWPNGRRLTPQILDRVVKHHVNQLVIALEHADHLSATCELHANALVDESLQIDRLCALTRMSCRARTASRSTSRSL